MTLLRVLQPEDDEQAAPDVPVFEELLSARKRASYSAGMIVKGILGPTPVTVLNYASADVERCLTDVLARGSFDMVQLETSNLFSYLKIIRSAPSRPGVLLDWHNIDSELMFRYAVETGNLPKKLIARRTAGLLSKLETRLMGLCDAHTVVSEPDKRKLLKHNPKACVTVIPNGVDASAFRPADGKAAGTGLLFVGSMDYHANVDAIRWFVQTVWPKLTQRVPALKLSVVGRSPVPEVQALASDRITVTGTVADVRPYYSDSAAVIVPLRVGGGTRLKILEAMAMGVPVISTTLGAEGIAAGDGDEILLADSADEMTQAVERILTDGTLRRRLVERARELVSKRYDWNAIGGQLYDVHRALLNGRANR